jgi:hypothetical protein
MNPIEDYALIADTHSGGLVALDGSIDWLCLPHFDSGSCFGAMLDEQRGGRWRLAPTEPVQGVERRYRPRTMVLETSFRTDGGRVSLIDLLAVEQGSRPDSPREVQPKEAVVRIEDTGLGMDAEGVSSLLQPFRQVHDPSEVSTGGTGLGLWITKGVVERHGGLVHAQSGGLGEGSTFTVRLPLISRERVQVPVQESCFGGNGVDAKVVRQGPPSQSLSPGSLYDR